MEIGWTDAGSGGGGGGGGYILVSCAHSNTNCLDVWNDLRALW